MTDIITLPVVYENILPYIQALNNVKYLDEDDKKERCINFIIEILNKASIKRDLIIKVRTILINKDNIQGIINYMNTVIANNILD